MAPTGDKPLPEPMLANNYSFDQHVSYVFFSHSQKLEFCPTKTGLSLDNGLVPDLSITNGVNDNDDNNIDVDIDHNDAYDGIF